jgi:predicted lactoylglutathione lyase
MKTRRIWANLAVSDLDRTTRFYTAIGFKPNGASDELTSFTVGEDNFIIHFFVKDTLEAASKGRLADLQHGNEIIFTLAAESKNDVDNWAKEVDGAGGKVVSQPEEFGKGYYGFVFSDPDGHKFNVFYMEGMM